MSLIELTARALTLTTLTLAATGVTLCPRQELAVAQREQMSFWSVPQYQSSSASCSTQSSHSTEKMPDSASEMMAVGDVAPPPASPPPPQVLGDAAASLFTRPANTEKMGCSHSTVVPFAEFKVCPGEGEHVRAQVVKSSVMAR